MHSGITIVNPDLTIFSTDNDGGVDLHIWGYEPEITFWVVFTDLLEMILISPVKSLGSKKRMLQLVIPSDFSQRLGAGISSRRGGHHLLR